MALTPEEKAAWEREKAEKAERRRQEEELARIKNAEGEQLIDRVVNKADRREMIAKLAFVVIVMLISLSIGFLLK